MILRMYAHGTCLICAATLGQFQSLVPASLTVLQTPPLLQSCIMRCCTRRWVEGILADPSFLNSHTRFQTHSC